MPKTRRRRGSSRTRRAGTKSRRGKRGGSLLAGVVGALKTALPSIVLYEALRAQGKRTKRGGKSYRKRGRGRGHKRGKGTRRHKRK
jgi:hypothetical protein